MPDRYIEGYPYVDFFSMRDGVPSKWVRILSETLSEKVASVAGAAVFESVQHFASPTPVEADTPEIHYAFPYADFDAEDVADSQRDVLRLINFCRDDLDLDDSEIRVWFSGKKGFHVVLSPVAFGVQPSTDLTYIYKAMFGHLKAYLDLPTLDSSVYTKRRMWRVPGTVHPGTGLYKIELDHDQVTDTIESIRELATSPIMLDDEGFATRRIERAAEFYDTFRDEYASSAREAAASKPVRLHPEAAPGDPVCVTDVMNNGLRKPGDRNKATVVLGSYYKDVGRDERLAITDITDWALRLPPEHRRSDDRYIKANTESTVKAVYDGAGYHFGCAFIRSLSGPKPTDGSKQDRIACMGDACPFIKEPAPETSEMSSVHLSRTGSVEWVAKPVKVQLRVAGRADSPYLVPLKIKIRSYTDECDRAGCALHARGGEMTLDFSDDLRTLVAFCNVPDNQQKVVIRELVYSSSCKKWSYTEESKIEMTEVAAMPKASSVIGDRHASVEGDWAYKQLYVMGDLDLKVNKYYEVVGTSYSHPKSQKATMVVTEATALRDEIEDFDLAESIPLLKVYTDMPFEGRVGHLLADIGLNVCKVGGRDLALLGVLMTIHSPLSLAIGDERYGGWMNTLIVGDTGEAKSQMVERLMAHIGLGTLTSAASSGRTGLLYTIVNKDTAHNYIQWGSFVLNDRGLLTIDEASGMQKGEYAEMRNARKDGRFEVNRSVTGEANTRTRLLVLSNPAWGRVMRHYQNGIESTLHLFENADIRRFDLVVGFKAGQVKSHVIAEALAEEVRHVFTSDVLRANVLWAWSRKPEDIYWHPGVVERVKAAAKRLNQKYSGSNIHLLSQDANEKIGRMAQAMAATFHSTDDLHIMLHVKPEHVDMVEQLVDSLYSAGDLSYDFFVRRTRDPEDTDWDGIEFEYTRSMDVLGVAPDEIYEVFDKNSVVPSVLLDAICGETKVSKSVLRQLVRQRLAEAGKGGYQPTMRMNELLNRWHSRTGK